MNSANALQVFDVPRLIVPGGKRVAAVGTTRRLQALVAIGYSQARICERLQILPSNASLLFCGGQARVCAATARKVAALFAELRLVAGPDPRARRRAARRGWQPPSAWDTERIDDPASRPRTCSGRPGAVVALSGESGGRCEPRLSQRVPAGQATGVVVAPARSAGRGVGLIGSVARPTVVRPAPARRRTVLIPLPVVGAPDQAWAVDALCPQTDPDAFYPEKGGSPREAKHVCVQCPARMPCLEWALDHDEGFGIWGGFSVRERRRLQNTIDGLDAGERRRRLADHMWPTADADAADSGTQPAVAGRVHRARKAG
jgi:hypothetical protein